ncbi:DNA-methyltransferase [Burkholderia ubonensis]|uniref:Methyltransferase n=1 Tax=Burkholderia ubonensis TaxID=101571 RepID=A0ABD4E831_9BURK|nr:site-specific DNA-methyltransferase [Burkholderia ubonensis]KVN88911.1 DNA methyltransferase [Burkholderia ubonensis]
MRDWIDRCHFGDCRELLRAMIAAGVKVQTIVTSPPYWGLRSYLPDYHPDKRREIGQESSLAEWLAVMVDVFDLCRELLADDGTAWVNMGDAYASASGASGGRPPIAGTMVFRDTSRVDTVPIGLKPKDLMGQPWRLAFALQDAGWYLRQDIIWHKPNPMPESVRDRCTKAHEYLFLLSKSERYYFDTDAMREPRAQDEDSAVFRGGCYVGGAADNGKLGKRKVPGNKSHKGTTASEVDDKHRTKAGLVAYAERERSADPADLGTRNRRSVWTIATQPYAAAHFATFPEALVEPCVLAGSRPGDVVFDPFFGSGTTGQVSQRLGRHFVGFELNPDYERLQRDRLRQPALALV